MQIYIGPVMTKQKVNWRPSVGRWRSLPKDFWGMQDWKDAPKDSYYRLVGKHFARFRRELDRLEVPRDYVGTSTGGKAWFLVHEGGGHFKLELAITRHYCGGYDCDNWDSYKARLVAISKREFDRLNSEIDSRQPA